MEFNSLDAQREACEERPLKAPLSNPRNRLKTLTFAKPNRAGQGSLGLRRKRFRDGNSAQRQSPKFGRLC